MKKWLIVVVAVVLFTVVVLVGSSAYLGYSMTRVERVPVAGNPGEFGLSYENVTFPSRYKDLGLSGWYLPAEGSDRIIIMVHGAGENRNDKNIGMLDIATGLVGNGYNILMFDLHGYGESEGNTVSGGYYEKKDLEGAVDYIQGRGFHRIGVLGFSLGAVTTLTAAAENTDIKAVVSDSSFADLDDIMGTEFSKRTRAPRFFLNPILFMIKIMYRVDFTAIRPIDAVPKIAPRPIFFIHGENDEVIPVAHARRLFEASNTPENRLWIVPQTAHTRSYKLYPEEYMKKVRDFFNTALN
ncbi:MAG: alpha/beta fold hydrolase [Dehalococcoidales bacterium]|nr:alpha/beta fold hydrolase [Dehalococcoidales bacterium]